MRFHPAALTLFVALGACSGDDVTANRSTTTPAARIASLGDARLGGGSDGGGGGGGGAASTAKVALSEDMAAPYFATGPAGAAAKRFALHDWKAARDGFAAYLRGPGKRADEKTRARAKVLRGISHAKLRAWGKSAADFESALRVLPVISDYLHYQAARAHYFAHHTDKALGHARKVAASSIRGADAELLVGDILRAKKQWPRIARHYAKYLADRPTGMRLSEARHRLAEAYERLGKAIPEAITLYRKITTAAPVSKWSTRATKRIDKILATRNAKVRARWTRLSPQQYLERGLAYYKAQRNRKSAADLDAALAASSLSKEDACIAGYHRANSWWKERKRRIAAPLFDKAIALCANTSNELLQIKSAYQGGRSYAMARQHDKADRLYAKVEQDHPKHSYADDARLRRAEEQKSLGKDARMVALLSNFVDLYPKGDMRAEATWRLAWRAYKKKQYRTAIRWLEKQIATMPIDDNYWAEGQAQYWLGRSWGRLGKRKRSADAYEQAVRAYPLSYYAMLALNRLRESHPRRFRTLRASLKKAPAGYDKTAPAFSFRPRALYGSPGFRRAMEYLRLGLGPESEAELRALGLTAPKKKKRVEDADQIDKLWAMAFLYDRAGRYQTSHWPTRWHILDYKRKWPVGKNLARWTIAYPRPYADLVAKNAKKHGYPGALQMGIMREESAFNPLLESWANAIGLTQMIFPTARRFGRGTGIAITRANLRDPDKNMTIGSNFLGFLWKLWEGRTALVPPSYNAGEYATRRWLVRRGTWAADEWIEAIPGDQARRYSKRVLASYFVYAYLYEGKIPRVRNKIPAKLITKLKAPRRRRRR